MKKVIIKFNKEYTSWLEEISSNVRKIISLYRKRYSTGEQGYTVDGEERRVNGLLRYPIFITAD